MKDDPELRGLLRRAGRLEGAALEAFLAGLSPAVRRALWEAWGWQAHRGQEEPEGEWRVWLMRAGRGFGKTIAGARWVLARAREVPGARIALVGGALDEVVSVMVEGDSGIVAESGEWERPHWVASRRRLDFPGGAQAFAYSAERPEKLRGPQHHFAWCDELAKWGKGDETWDNLQMGMRLGERPRLVVTSTPRPSALFRRVMALEGTVETRGRTWDNVHSAEAFRRWAGETYGGTRLGRQELEGELLLDVRGALWTRETIERARHGGTLPREALERVVIGVDPPASAEGDACGIVVCGMGEDGVGYVLADHSVSGLSPEGWAGTVAAAAEAWEADRVVAEANNGGAMVRSVLEAADSGLPVSLVHAAQGKSARAEPVALRFESGRARLAGRFPELEDQLAGMTIGGGYQGPGRSPDRADAMVYALSELFRGEARPAPRIRRL